VTAPEPPGDHDWEPERAAVRLAQWLTILTSVPTALLAFFQGRRDHTMSPWLVALTINVLVVAALILALWRAPMRVRATLLSVGATILAWLAFLHFGPLIGVGFLFATASAMWTIFFGRTGMILGVAAMVLFVALTAWASLHGLTDLVSRSPSAPRELRVWLRSWATVSASLIFFNGVIHALHIRYRAQLERERRARVAAEEATRLRDEFIALASHELRTPLTSLKLLVQLRRATDTGTDPSTAVLERQLRRFERLIRSMLDATLLAAGQATLTCVRSDLVQITADVLGSFDDEIRRSGSTVTLNAPSPVEGHWDRENLDLVLSNLVGNAIKFGEGRPIEITVESAELGDNARVVVRDHGIGIAREDLQQVFARFHRGVSYQHYGGLGLGLYITRELVRLHGGTVSVESEPGTGATFTVLLPRRPTAASACAPEGSTPLPAPGE